MRIIILLSGIFPVPWARLGVYTSPVSDITGDLSLALVAGDTLVTVVTCSDDPEAEETEHLLNCCLHSVRLSEQL